MVVGRLVVWVHYGVVVTGRGNYERQLRKGWRGRMDRRWGRRMIEIGTKAPGVDKRERKVE